MIEGNLDQSAFTLFFVIGWFVAHLQRWAQNIKRNENGWELKFIFYYDSYFMQFCIKPLTLELFILAQI